MTAPANALAYPKRRSGLDHDWFKHSPVAKRPKLAWPGGARIALWITVPVEFFPLDAPAQPFRPVGAFDRAYPDFYSYANRDYGNRIGIFRIMRVLDRLGLRATAAMNSDVARRYPRLVEEVLRRNWEIAASGVNMGQLHHAGLARDAEQALIAEAAATLRRASGQPVVGWHSPAHSQSLNTLELVAAAGFTYVMDWINDDLPYEMRTTAGPLYALPLTHEWSDRNILLQHELMIDDYEAAVLSALRCLDAEAKDDGGRVLSLSLTPWIVGYPHRISGVVRLLEAILASGSIWPATGVELLDSFRKQQAERPSAAPRT
jgi:peptidoglycan/xylan/chitin deacetylase (PgdA/CDA1 family)